MLLILAAAVLPAAAAGAAALQTAALAPPACRPAVPTGVRIASVGAGGSVQVAWDAPPKTAGDACPALSYNVNLTRLDVVSLTDLETAIVLGANLASVAGVKGLTHTFARVPNETRFAASVAAASGGGGRVAPELSAAAVSTPFQLWACNPEPPRLAPERVRLEAVDEHPSQVRVAWDRAANDTACVVAYEVKVFDGAGKPLTTGRVQTEEAAPAPDPDGLRDVELGPMEQPTPPSFTFKAPPAVVKAQGVLKLTVAAVNGGAAGPAAHASARLDLVRRRRVRQWSEGVVDNPSFPTAAETEPLKEGARSFVQPCAPTPLKAPPRRLDVWQAGPQQGAAAGPLTLFVWPPYPAAPKTAAGTGTGDEEVSDEAPWPGIAYTWDPSACVAAYVIKATDPTTGQVIASQTVATMNPLDARTRVELQPGSPLAEALLEGAGPSPRSFVLSAAACGRPDLPSGSPRDCGPALTLPPATLAATPKDELRLCSSASPVREPVISLLVDEKGRLSASAALPSLKGYADIDCITSLDAALLDPATKRPLAGCAPDSQHLRFGSLQVGSGNQVEASFNCTDALADLIKAVGRPDANSVGGSASGAPKRLLLRTAARSGPRVGGVQDSLLRIAVAPSLFAFDNSTQLVICKEMALHRPLLSSVTRATAGQPVVDVKSGQLVSVASGDVDVDVQRSGSDSSACIDMYDVVLVLVAPSAGAPRRATLRLANPTKVFSKVTIKGGGPPGARFYVNITAVSQAHGRGPTLQTAVAKVPLSTSFAANGQDGTLLQRKVPQFAPVASLVPVSIRAYASREKVSPRLYQRPAAACSESFC